METSDNRDGQLRAMALIASLRTAAEVCQTMALRRQGEDPSAQEESQPVRQHLREAREELRELVVQLRLSLAVEPTEESGLVRAFEDRMLLAQAARALHVVHQRLLSLYPEVEPDLVEQARVVQAEAARLASVGDGNFGHSVAAWCDTCVGFADALGAALYTPN